MSATNVMELFAKLGLDSSEFNKGLTTAQGKMSKIGGAIGAGFATIAKAGTAAFAATTGAATAFSATAVKKGAEFDQAISQVAATMGASVDEIGQLRDFAEEMGATTAFTAVQAAESLNYMALAGYDAETSMEMLPNVLNLAAAGGIDLAYASDMITDSQSALGLSLDETSQLVDKMAKTASRSNTSVSQLGEAILQIGGSAKKLSGGTTELTAILGILADNGMKGAEGGTHLRNMLTSLMSPTKDATKMMEDLGVSLYDADGNMRLLNDVFLDLKNGIDSLATQQEKDNVVTTLFNARDMKAAEALLAGVGDRYAQLSSEIDEAAGSAQTMADVQLDNLAGDVTKIKSAFEGVQIVVSDKLTPTLRKFTQFGTRSLSSLTTAIKEDGVDGVIDALDPIIDEAFALLDEVMPQVIEIGALFTTKFAIGLTKKLPDIVNSGIEIATLLGKTVVDEAPELISSIVTALDTLGTELYEKALAPAWDFAINQLPELINEKLAQLDLTEAGEAVSTAISGLFNGIGTFIDNIDWEEVGAKIGEFMSGIDWSGIISSVFDVIADVVKNTPDLLKGVVENLDPEAQAVVAGLAFGKLFGSKIANTILTNPEVASALSSAGSFISTKLSPVLAGAVAGWSIGSAIYDVAGDWLDEHVLYPIYDAVGAFGNGWVDLWELIGNNFFDAIEETKGHIDNFKETYTDWSNYLGEELDVGIENVKGFFSELKGVTDAIGGFFENVGGTVFDITQWVGEKAGDVKDWFGDVKDNIVGFKDSVAETITEFKDNWAEGALAIWDKIDGMKDKWNQFKINLSDSKAIISEKIGDIKEYFSGLGTKIQDVVAGALDWGRDLVKNFISGIEEKFGELNDTLEGFGETVYDWLHQSTAEKGPLKDTDVWGVDFADNYINGIESKKGELKNEVASIADIFNNMNSEIKSPEISLTKPELTETQDGDFNSVGSGTGSTMRNTAINLSVDGELLATVLAPFIDVIQGRQIQIRGRGMQT